MSAAPQFVEHTPSRRGFLAAAAAAVAAMAGSAVRQAPAAHAANGDAVILGQANTATSPTEISSSTVALHAVGGNVPGLNARSLEVTGPLGNLVGTAIHAVGTMRGISGDSRNADADLGAGIGVQGVSGTGAGVRGDCPNGTGVRGTTTSGTGVEGFNDGAGIGVAATAPAGTALHVFGKASFSRSGRLTIPAGRRSASVTGIALTADSVVLATVQQNTSVAVQGAIPSPGTDRFTVRLTGTSASPTIVGWFIVN